MYGKGITSVFDTSIILSPNAPRYQGFKFQDEIYIINSSLKSKMILKKDDRYRLLKDSNPSNLMDFGDLAKGTRYGIGVRVMDFYWVSGGSVHSSSEGEIYILCKRNCSIVCHISLTGFCLTFNCGILNRNFKPYWLLGNSLHNLELIELEH